MKRFRSLVAFVFLAIQAVTVQAGTITFGSTGNQFTMEFVSIGNPRNAADTTGTPATVGRVDYIYSIGKFEVNEDMINKYNTAFGTANSLVISKDSRGTNKPATNITWNEAARFVNWLNTNTSNSPAYKFATNGVNDNIELWNATNDPLDFDASNPYRSKRAVFALPSYNEWYKAAYYDPSNSSYWDFPTGSNNPPVAVASGTQSGTAVYKQPFVQGPAEVNLAGGLSPYFVMGMGGNVHEWEESSSNLSNSGGGLLRAYRGGDWNDYGPNTSDNMKSTSRGEYNPANTHDNIGFRVVMLSSGGEVPEPSSFVIASLFGLGGLARRRFSKK